MKRKFNGDQVLDLIAVIALLALLAFATKTGMIL